MNTPPTNKAPNPLSDQRVEAIATRIRQAFQPSYLTVHDDSAKHQGHPGHLGAGHFRVTVIADAFAGKSRLACHKMIYAVLDEMMGKEIHALQIHATAGEEVSHHE